MNIFSKNEDGNIKNQDGFILPIIIITGLIIGAGLMALSARTFANLFGSIRMGQAQTARNAAESGMAIILKELNRNYPYLIINDCSIESPTGEPFCTGWSANDSKGGTFSYITSVCPQTITPPDEVFSVVAGILPNKKSEYRLISFDFTGDQHQGGTARIKIKGSTRNNSRKPAIAYIDQEVNITPKPCNGAQGGYPGVLCEDCTGGNLDLFGAINGNFVCTNCPPNQSQEELAEDIGLKDNGFVEGQIFGGQISLPKVPDFPIDDAPDALKSLSPADLSVPDTQAPEELQEEQKTSKTVTLTAQTTPGANNSNRCFTDTANITHCRINTLTLNGDESLVINTSAQGTPPPTMRLYVTGNIAIAGTASLVHTGNAKALGIFGNARQQGDCSQTVTLGGGSQTLNLFAYMPDACAGINGGGNADPVLQGSIWVRKYGGKTGSNSNAAAIRVPDDIGSDVCTQYGINFCVGIREYAARGRNKWSLVLPPQ